MLLLLHSKGITSIFDPIMSFYEKFVGIVLLTMNYFARSAEKIVIFLYKMAKNQEKNENIKSKSTKVLLDFVKNFEMGPTHLC